MGVRIVLTGAGTGGHIFPLVAVAEEIRAVDESIDMLYVGTRAQLSDRADEAMREQGIPVKHIATGKMRRYFSLHYFLDFLRIPFGILQSLWILWWYMPDAIFSKGGYASVPVVVAAWLYRIPVMTHESDAVPGWANRINGKLSHFVAITFEASRKFFSSRKSVLTGVPVRPLIAQGDGVRGRQRWGIDSQEHVVLVFGGSQGAYTINRAIISVLPEVTHTVHVFHITGERDKEDAESFAKEMGFRGKGNKYTQVTFLSRTEMADAYAIADVVIARPGATTIAELAATGSVSLLIPHPTSANNHQRMNAYTLAETGAALVLDEGNIGRHILKEKITQLLRSGTLRDQFSTNIRAYYHPDAAARIVEGVLKMVKK